MIKRPGHPTAEVYSWSAYEDKWTKTGDLMDNPNDGATMGPQVCVWAQLGPVALPYAVLHDVPKMSMGLVPDARKTERERPQGSFSQLQHHCAPPPPIHPKRLGQIILRAFGHSNIFSGAFG